MLVDNLILTKSLGKGSFGEVFLTKKVKGTELYATKRMDRADYEKPDNHKRLINEISILKALKHPNIIRLIEVKKTKSHIYIVTEFCNGGDLSGTLNSYMKIYQKPFSEEIVQHFMRQILSALNYLHRNHIIHRDLKLENILLNFPTKEDKTNLNLLKAQAKLIDFGFATKLKIQYGNITNTILGTPSNMEPHMLRNMEKHQPLINGYNEKVDIWSLGTLCYEMLCGRMTFYGRTMDELYQKVKQGTYKLPLWLSKEAVSFINGMLQYDGEKRLSSDELLKHDFIRKNVKDFQKIDVNKVKGKVEGKKLKINIKDNKTIWGIFNEDNNNNNYNNNMNFNMNKPLKEEDNIINFNTMPNMEYNENILKKNENKNKNKINFIKESESGFAQVKIIEDSKMNNLGNNFNNNNQFIQGKQRPLTHQTHHENIYNPQKLQINDVPSNHKNLHQTFQKSNNMINQNYNQINNNYQDFNEGFNYDQGHHHKHKHENNAQLKRVKTVPTYPTQNNNDVFQPSIPQPSQVENYFQSKNTDLNDFF